MLSREPAQRPSSLAEVRRVLGTLTTAQAPDFGEPQIELATPSESLTLPPGDTRAPLTRSVKTTPPRRSRVAPVAAVVAVAGLVALAFGLTRNAPNDAEHATASAPRAPPPEAASSGSSPTALLPTVATATATAPAPTTSPFRADSPSPEGSIATETPRAAPARAKRSSRGSKANEADAPSSVAADAPTGLATGAACERSRDCASRLCLAFVCK